MRAFLIPLIALYLYPTLPTAPASARPRSFSHKISPEIELWFASPHFRRFRGRRLAGGPEAAAQLDRVGVTVRLRQPNDLRLLVDAEGPDLRLTRIGGHLMRLGRIVAARVTEDGLATLRSIAEVVRVELDMRSPFAPPLDHTTRLIEADAVWATLDTAGVPLTGAGVIIADIDSGIDVYHPMFFKADGGYYDWMDADFDGVFTPGVDRVDLNGNGIAEAAEQVEFYDVVAHSTGGFTTILNTDDGVYDLGWDQLYVDVNGNGERDFGGVGGYGEDDPGFGEPLLVPDDVNGNGVLDPGEKLVMLSTSKVLGVLSDGTEYLRGAQLSTLPHWGDAFHGTGVSGILVGGQLGFTRLTGIAPDAELIVADTGHNADPNGDLAPLLIWTVQQGADVMVHEYAPWVGVFLDGSSNHESLMDTAAADNGVAQVNPAGNLGGSQKHGRIAVSAQDSADLPVEVPPDPQPGVPEYEYKYMQLSFLWREPARDVYVSLQTPGGEVVDLGAVGTGWNPVVLADGTTQIYAWREDSARGTAKYEIMLFGQSGMSYVPIENGTWQLTLSDPDTTDPTAGPLTVWTYVMDDISSWGLGVNFPQHHTEEHLICFPATADSAIGVAAYTGHAGEPYSRSDELQGELRRYSGRGNRIDGVALLDIAAPDNPLTAMNRGGWGGIAPVGLGHLTVFGGTSGAGPHVGGAAALIKQLDPDLDGLEVRQALREGALVDSQVVGDASHTVEDLWGAGKLRIYQTLYGESPVANTAPTVHLTPRYATLGEPVTLTVTADDAEDDVDALQLRWDDDYDGAWDHGPAPATESRDVTFDATGIHVIKVQVVDTGGLTGEALGTVEVLTGPTCEGSLCPDGGVSPDGGSTINPRSDGCNCRSGGAGGAALPVLLALALILLGRVRRRR